MRFNLRCNACMLVVAGLLSAPVWADVKMPLFYGRADLSLNRTTVAGASGSVQTNSNASRLGIHNNHAISDSLDIFYRLEYEVDFDERHNEPFKSRNAVLGLGGSWGEVFFGIHDTPLKKAELNVDQFNDVHRADMAAILSGQDRVSDSISYMSPKIGGLQGWVMLLPGDDASDNPGTDSGGGSDGAQGDGLADAVSASLVYRKPLWQLALAYNNTLKQRDTLRASGQVNIGRVQLGALLQHTRLSTDNRDDGLGFVLSSAVKLTAKDTLKLQYSRTDEQAQEAVAGGDLISLGIDHKLAKTTKLYLYYSDLSVDNNPAAEMSTLGLGLRHNFGQSK